MAKTKAEKRLLYGSDWGSSDDSTPYTPPPTPSIPSTPGTPPAVGAVSDPQAPLGDILKTMMPNLSPEDQKALSVVYGLDQTSIPGVPGQMNSDIRNAYLSKERASKVKTDLENLRAAKGGDLGAGYNFLIKSIDLLNSLGGTPGQGMGSQAQSQLQTSYNTLMQNTPNLNQIDPYVNLANLFLMPSFSSGSLMPTEKVGNRTFYGSPNRQFYV